MRRHDIGGGREKTSSKFCDRDRSWGIAFAPRAEALDITTCQTISKSGLYELAANLITSGNCLVISASFVTIDLKGFSIDGTISGGTTDITASKTLTRVRGITVRNGSISGFGAGLDLTNASNDSIVEGLRVIGGSSASENGIFANGIVKDNIVYGYNAGIGGIAVGGVVTGNYVADAQTGIAVPVGSTVTGNTVNNNRQTGLLVVCPSNVTKNTAVNNPLGKNLVDWNGLQRHQ
jgi:hypothetical protein